MDLNFTIDANQAINYPVEYAPVRKAPKAPTRSFGRSGSGGRATHYDGFGRRFTPDKNALIQEYKRAIYTCANLNAQACITTPLRLYLKMDSGGRDTVLRNGQETKSLSSKKIDYLSSLPYLGKTLRSYVDIEEVVIHPALEILERGSDSQHMNGFKLQELLYLYMDITGEAYWLIENNVLGIPQNIWILPSQNILPRKREGSRKIVDFYEYQTNNNKSINYKPEDVIPFLSANLNDPYIGGKSFVEAAYEANKAHNQLLTLEAALLENEGRPEFAIIPDDESGIGPDEADKLEDEWKARFGRGRQGGVFVMPEKVKLEPVQVPLRDLARMEISKWTKNDIANAAQVPFALISDASHNRQQLEAAEIQHSKHGVIPRQKRVACTLNDQLLTRYDVSRRLFFAYDNPIPEDSAAKLQENVQLKINGIITANEVRDEYNRPPLPDGDKLESMNDPKEERQKARDSGSAEK